VRDERADGLGGGTRAMKERVREEREGGKEEEAGRCAGGRVQERAQGHRAQSAQHMAFVALYALSDPSPLPLLSPVDCQSLHHSTPTLLATITFTFYAMLQYSRFIIC